MGNTLLTLAIPVPVLVSGLCTACSCWWQRRHPAPPSPYTQQAARLAAREALAGAEGTVTQVYAALGRFYDTPGTQDPARSATTVPVTSGPGSSPDPGRSQPAPVRKR
ncbi:hypothetical protein NKH18_22520 [Streptomyces sp. M10(2022)]